jgi:fatty acid synthase subunit alpha, fungi type
VKWYELILIVCDDPYLTGSRIDTQDVLLDQQKTERLVEIGPSDTLTVMAKRTIKSKYEAQDATLARRRQLLSGDADLAEIYYEVDPQPVAAEQSSASANATNDCPPPYSPEPTISEAPKPSAAPAPTNSAVSSKKKPDTPVTALEILVGIVAQKLKKPSSDIAVASTIKSLASGMYLMP